MNLEATTQLIHAIAQCDLQGGDAIWNDGRIWELVAQKMSIPCSAAQCKRDWAMLVARYKKFGGSAQDFPLFAEVDAILKARATALSAGEFSGKSEDDCDVSRGVQEVLRDLLEQQQRGEVLWEQEMDRNSGLVDARDTVMLLQPKVGPSAELCKREEACEYQLSSWGSAETKCFMAAKAKAELEQQERQVGGLSNVWELVSAHMKQRGYCRTSEECKHQWWKLVNGSKRLSGRDNLQKLPFREDPDAISSHWSQDRRPLLGDGEGSPASRASVENLSDEGDSGDAMDVQRKRRKLDAGVSQVLCDFISKQQDVEKQWQEFLSKKELEWQQQDEEWRRSMLKLEQQRSDREKISRERQEQRRARQDARADNMDLLFALLVKNV